MAEVLAAIGIVASVAQLADYGFKLSVKLFTFSQAISTADQSIRGLSNDVSLTSTVLQELCHLLKTDSSNVVSPRAVEATQQTVRECLRVFEQLGDALDRSLANLGKMEIQSGKRVGRGAVALEKLKWPFRKQGMELLRSDLERLKASLMLMLQVLSYARDVSNSKVAEASLAYQKRLIESLARSERDMKRKYYSLQMMVESQTPVISQAAVNMSVEITRDVGIDDTLTHFESGSPPAAKPRTLIGELLLCFQLLNDILGYHMAVTTFEDLSTHGYDELRAALEKIQRREMKRLEAEYGDASIYVKSEAATNLHTRLRELAKAGYLKKRVMKEQEPGATKLGEDTNSKIQRLRPGRTKSEAQELSISTVLGDDVDQLSPIPPYEKQSRPKSNRGTTPLKVDRSDSKSHPPPTATPHHTQSELVPVPNPDTKWLHLVKDHNVQGSTDSQEPYDPFDHPSPTSSTRTLRIAALQAEIDNTGEVMRQHITDLERHGEITDALQDRTEDLAVSGQGYRRGANRVRKGPWTRAYQAVTENVTAVTENVAKMGTEGLRSVRGVYAAGARLIFEGADGEEEGDFGRMENAWKSSLGVDEVSEDGKDEDLVDELLAQWTTLPLQDGGKVRAN